MQLVISPTWDDADVSEARKYNTRFTYLTEYLNWIASEIADYVSEFDTTTFLSGWGVSAAVVQSALQQQRDFSVLYYATHGYDDGLVAVGYEPAITVENASPLFGKTTYAIACSSAAGLGVKVAENGGVYIGYDDVLYIEFGYRGPETDWWLEEVYRDIWARGRALVHSPPSDVVSSIVQGYDDAIQQFINDGYDYTWLLHNREHLRLLGAHNWQLPPETPPQPAVTRTLLPLAAAAAVALLMLVRK